MTDARIETVYEDKVRAREFLAQAELLLKDANTATISAEGQAILLHNATLAACDAILQAVGLRVTPGDRAHVIRLEAALAELPGDTEDLLESLDAARERRNEASYLAGFVAQASVADAREATTELIGLTQQFLSR
jgi:hypothetical protein